MSEETVAANDKQKQQDAGMTTAAGETKKPRSRTRSRKTQEQVTVAASEAGEHGESAAHDTAEEHDSLDRAEQLVAEWTVRAEQIGAEIGHQFVRLFARAREEAEDIWAEAQELRRNGGTQHGDQQE